jgi:hypothetical protein
MVEDGYEICLPIILLDVYQATALLGAPVQKDGG